MTLKHYTFLLLLVFAALLFTLNNKVVNKDSNILNNKNEYKEANGDMIFSTHKSGFYSHSFKLFLTPKDKHEIRYTFDGSNPTNQSCKFEKQLLITGDESLDSLSFINTTIPDSIGNFGWREPKGRQDRITILKYGAFYKGDLISEIKTLTFFIDDNWRNSFHKKKHKLPIISISTNKENLFSMDSGIYVSGNSFNPDKNPSYSGNYRQRGKESERQVHLSYFNTEGELDFELDLGMRIHGGITRQNPQKSLKFYARKEFGAVEVPLSFLAKKGVKRFIVESMQESGSGQALIEDISAQEIVKRIGLEQQTFQAVIVFINGEYWGLHTIRDRLDEHYLAYKYNISIDSLDIIDGNPEKKYPVIHGSNSDYINLINFIKANDLSLNQNYSYINDKIDIENFINYYSVQMFFANYDWPIHNIKIWRKNNSKWRFLLYDLDGGFTGRGSGRDHTLDMFSRLSNQEECVGCGNTPEATVLFRGLMKNNKFRDRFFQKYQEITYQYMNPEITLAIVDSIADIYRPNMQSHINRWRYPWSLHHHWQRDIEKHVKDFLIHRPTATLNNLKEYINDRGYDN